MKIVFQERDFSRDLKPLPLAYKVELYSHSVYGGPKEAVIKASGEKLALWELFEYVRRPITIWNDVGEIVWWGFVAQVDLQVGTVKASVGIDSMYNSISVAYTADNGRQTTGFAIDADSVAEYGTRQLLLTVSGSSAEHALAARAMAIAQKRYPIPTIQPGQSNATRNQVSLRCRGWWSTLDWCYYSQSAGFEANLVSGDGEQDVGRTSGNTKVAQAFRLSVPWVVKTVDLFVKQVGTPADNLTVHIYADSSGSPGTLLSVGWSESTTDITTSMAQQSINALPGSEVLLAADTTYWLVVSRSGAIDGTNYFVVDLTEGLEYTDGALKIYNGSAWVARTPDADLNFVLGSSSDTAIQAADIARIAGQFFSAVNQDTTSGILTSTYRDGDGKAMFEALELLQMGTSNYRRMLARVDPNRILTIYEEPEYSPASDANLMIDSSGTLYDRFRNPLRKDSCPVGEWVRLVDIVPGSVDSSRLADPGLAFIDEAEYKILAYDDQGRVKSDALIYRARDVENPWNVGRPKDG